MRRTGYIALLGHDGQPLWESPGHIWSQATIEALMRTGEDVISVGRLSRQEARAYFPQLFRFDVGGWIKRVLLGLLVLVVAFVVIIRIVSVVVSSSWGVPWETHSRRPTPPRRLTPPRSCAERLTRRDPPAARLTRGGAASGCA